MPMQNAALWIALLGRPRKFELYLPKTEDDTVTETLGEGWSYDVRRHDCRWKNVYETAVQGSDVEWEHAFIYTPLTALDSREFGRRLAQAQIADYLPT